MPAGDAKGPAPNDARTSDAERAGSDAQDSAAERGDSDVVRLGGVAERDDQTEDVTRDTYGFPSSAPPARSREERIAEANRAAEQAGLPGVDVPEWTDEGEAPPGRED